MSKKLSEEGHGLREARSLGRHRFCHKAVSTIRRRQDLR
jgi:hypothetical protein